MAWHEKTAFEVAQALQTRRLSAEHYVAACFEQIDAREPEVRAFAYLHREGALQRARALDRLWRVVGGGYSAGPRARRPPWSARARWTGCTA